MPVALASTSGVHGAVAEDGLSAALGNSSTGLLDAGQSTASDETSGLAGSLATLFAPGADRPLTFGVNLDTSGMPVLYSHGVQLVYTAAGDTVTATAGAVTVFTLQVNSDGSWSFDLKDQLDHVAGSGDSGTLLRSSGSSSVSSIDFSSMIVATDGDGDHASGAASGTFTIASKTTFRQRCRAPSSPSMRMIGERKQRYNLPATTRPR